MRVSAVILACLLLASIGTSSAASDTHVRRNLRPQAMRTRVPHKSKEQVAKEMGKIVSLDPYAGVDAYGKPGGLRVGVGKPPS